MMLRRCQNCKRFTSLISFSLQAAAEKKTSCEAFVEVNNMVTCDMDAMAAYIKVAAGQ